MIAVSNLAYAYPRDPRPVLHGLDFSVSGGEIFGFLGPSGAGKSTTQKILIGLIREYTGAVSFQGRELRDWGREFYERIGVSFEVPNHFLKLTAAENLAYFGRLYSGKLRPAAELLDQVGLARDAGKRVGEFSKGMKNRLSVARALLHGSEALFLDEPTAGLDPASARRIKDLIAAQRDAGRCVVLTTHDMAIADELCDRVAFIVDGRILTLDRPRDLKLKHGEAKVRVEARRPDGTLETREFPLEGLGGNAEFAAMLRGRQVETLHTLEASLEDVFLAVTGRALS